MPDSPAPAIRLFSYGTLRQAEVQIANFGRLLAGAPDAVTGYRLSTVAIEDPKVIADSGSAVHPILVATSDPADRVDGIVFLITRAELDAADAYETGAYVRVEAPLASGARAWVYVAPEGHSDGNKTL